jgi:hypothetical protein
MGKIGRVPFGSEARRGVRGAFVALAALLVLSACTVDGGLVETHEVLVVAATSADGLAPSELGVGAEPLDGRTVSGVVTVALETTRNVTSVAFYLDDVRRERPPLAVLARAPFQITFDTALLGAGEHVLTAIASGRNGRRGREFTIIHEARFLVAATPAPPPAPGPAPTPDPPPDPVPPVAPPPPSGGPSAADILWHADHGDGTLNAWTDSGCGGPFNNGGATASASTAFAHSGRHSVALTIRDVSGDQGARLFRWCESRRADELYYSTWMYFPTAYVTTGGWWNVFQFKSKVSNSLNDPFFILNVAGEASGSMRFYLYDWHARRSYAQTAVTIPVGRWVHLEVRYRSSPNADGAITVWQDGTMLFDVGGVRTRYPDGDTQWSVNNYASGIHPDPATIYVDDATISRTRVGPGTDVAALLRAATATATR